MIFFCLFSIYMPVALVFQDVTVGEGETQSYLDSNSIQAAGDNTDFIILDGSEVTMKAGSYIHLKPGFEARAGCEFAASIFGTPSTSAIDREPENTTETPSEISSEEIPAVFSCAQNSPNPFALSTAIKYGLPEAADVKLEIYNLTGQKVRTLVDKNETAGFKLVAWDGCSSAGVQVPQGVYFYVFKAGDFRANKKMMVLR